MILFYVYSRKTGELVSTVRSLPQRTGNEIATYVAQTKKHDITDLEVTTHPKPAGSTEK